MKIIKSTKKWTCKFHRWDYFPKLINKPVMLNGKQIGKVVDTHIEFGKGEEGDTIVLDCEGENENNK